MDLLLNDEFDYDYDLRDLEDFVLLTTTSVIDIQESERAQAEREVAEFKEVDKLAMLMSPEAAVQKELARLEEQREVAAPSLERSMVAATMATVAKLRQGGTYV